METQVGGVWLNRIAVVLLILGTLYGFMWAVDNDYIGPAGRVALGYLAGVVAMAVGRSTHKRGYAAWSLGVTGGGIALLYVATFAAYQLYDLIPYWAAFGLMVLFALFSALLSLWYNAVAVAWLGALGGFLTPFLLYTGSGNMVGLFAYVAVLDIGVLGLAYSRKWVSLNVLGFAATWIVYGIGLESALWVEAFLFATLFWALLALSAILYHIAQRKPAALADLLLVAAGGFVYFGTGLGLLWLRPEMHPWRGFFAVAMALAYLGLGLLAMRRNREDSLLILALLGLSGLFLTIAIPVQLTGAWITMAWALEGIVLTALGLRLSMRPVWLAGAALCGIAALLLAPLTWDRDGLPRNLGFVTTIAALWAGTWLHRRHADTLPKTEHGWGALFALGASGLTLWWFAAEIGHHFEPLIRSTTDFGLRLWLQSQQDFLISTAWALYGLLLMVVGFARRLRGARLLAIGVLGLTLLKVAGNDIWNLTGGWRVIGLLSIGFVLLAASYLYFRFKDRITGSEGAPG